MKNGEMKHEMTLFHTMGPNRNVLFQTYLFVAICGLTWSSSTRFLTQDDAGPFEGPLLLRTPLYLVMYEERSRSESAKFQKYPRKTATKTA